MFRCYGIAILTISGNARRLFSHDLPLPPPFVRFGNVKVATYAVWNGSNSIGKIISSFGKYFNAFKASKLTLKATIDESDWSCFPNQTTMLDYLSNELLPIFDSSYCTFDFLYIRLSHTFHSCTFDFHIRSIAGKESSRVCCLAPAITIGCANVNSFGGTNVNSFGGTKKTSLSLFFTRRMADAIFIAS